MAKTHSDLLSVPPCLFSVSAVPQTFPPRLPLHHLCCVLLLQWITEVIAHTPSQTEPRHPFTAPFIYLLILTHDHMFSSLSVPYVVILSFSDKPLSLKIFIESKWVMMCLCVLIYIYICIIIFCYFFLIKMGLLNAVEGKPDCLHLFWARGKVPGCL